MKELNELVELANNATGGDWFVEDWNEVKSLRRFEGGKGVVCSVTEYGSMDEGFEHNLKFISAANPANILAIAEAFRSLEQEKDKAEVEKAGAEERIRMMFDAKNHWADRARAAEAKLETKEQELAQYVECFEAEAARPDRNHAKLAELERQPFAVVLGPPTYWHQNGEKFQYTFETKQPIKHGAKLFTRPAHAVSLSELVPDLEEDEPTFNVGLSALIDCLEDCGDAEQGLRLALRACRAAIFRNIEEAE